MGSPYSYYARFDLNKFKKDLTREIKRIGHDTIAKGFTFNDKQDIGYEMIDEIKSQVSKGISPIFGWGRFPGYKWVTRANRLLKKASGITGSGVLKKSKRKDLRALAKSTKKQGYPYTVKKQYPNKMERPVNLYLSGDFLQDLEARPNLKGLSFGFWKKKSAQKEEGHRDGVNGQPKRPIIPTGSETVSRPIYNRLLQAISRRMKTALSRSIRR